MKTLEQVVADYKCATIDRRDISRLAIFLSFDMFPFYDVELRDEVTEEEWNEEKKEFTRENVLAQLKEDVEFGFEKALNKRGISSHMMYSVVKMWNWILEEGLEDFTAYEQYGLPLFKATALKYGFDNPIGDDTGSESKYSQ